MAAEREKIGALPHAFTFRQEMFVRIDRLKRFKRTKQPPIQLSGSSARRKRKSKEASAVQDSECPYRHGYYVVDPQCLFDYERLAVLRSDQIPVMPCDSGKAVTNFRSFGKKIPGF